MEAEFLFFIVMAKFYLFYPFFHKNGLRPKKLKLSRFNFLLRVLKYFWTRVYPMGSIVIALDCPSVFKYL